MSSLAGNKSYQVNPLCVQISFVIRRLISFINTEVLRQQTSTKSLIVCILPIVPNQQKTQLRLNVKQAIPDKSCPPSVEDVSATYAKCLEFHLLFYNFFPEIQSEKARKSKVLFLNLGRMCGFFVCFVLFVCLFLNVCLFVFKPV